MSKRRIDYTKPPAAADKIVPEPIEEVVEPESIAEETSVSEFKPFRVRAASLDVRIRTGAGAEHPHNGAFLSSTPMTVVDVDGDWGLLEPYTKKANGWVNLTFTARVD